MACCLSFWRCCQFPDAIVGRRIQQATTTSELKTIVHSWENTSMDIKEANSGGPFTKADRKREFLQPATTKSTSSGGPIRLQKTYTHFLHNPNIGIMAM
jgi:hypothetical protein